MDREIEKAPAAKEARFQILDPHAELDSVPQPEPFAQNVTAYSAHTWVYACVSKIAQNLAGVELKAYRKDAKGKWVEFTKHPLLPLLARPNPYMSGYDLRELRAMSVELTGNSYWALEKLGTDSVKEIWPLPTELVEVRTSAQRLVEAYILKVNGKEIVYAPNEIIHFKTANPLSMLYGQGSLTAAKLPLIQDFYAQTWNKYFFQNSARPDAVLETKEVLDPPQRQRLKEAWRTMHQGASNRGKTAILENGITYKEINRTHEEMGFVELRKFSREEILAAFGVPPVVVGVFEYANYANSKEQIGLFWKQTLIPKLHSAASTLDLKSAQIFFDPITSFQADLSAVEALRVDEAARAATAKLYVDMGVPVNQVIAKLDLPFDPVKGGDEPRQLGAGFGTPDALSQNGEGKHATLIDVKALPSRTKDAGRDNEWKKFDAVLRDLEGPFESTMRGFFKGQKARVLKALNDNAAKVIASVKAYAAKATPQDITGVFDIDLEEELMAKVTGKHIRRAYEGNARRTAQQINPSVRFDMDDPLAVAFLENKVLKLVRQANKYTQESISEAVVEAVHEAVLQGFDAAETIAQIVDRIDEVFKFALDHRAERIARTEVISASNAGNLEAMRQLGAEEKEWLSSRDANVRDTHKELDGDHVALNESFMSSSGVSLDFPGDPNADPAEIINCRCNVRPYFKDNN